MDSKTRIASPENSLNSRSKWLATSPEHSRRAATRLQPHHAARVRPRYASVSRSSTRSAARLTLCFSVVRPARSQNQDWKAFEGQSRITSDFDPTIPKSVSRSWSSKAFRSEQKRSSRPASDWTMAKSSSGPRCATHGRVPKSSSQTSLALHRPMPSSPLAASTQQFVASSAKVNASRSSLSTTPTLATQPAAKSKPDCSPTELTKTSPDSALRPAPLPASC